MTKQTLENVPYEVVDWACREVARQHDSPLTVRSLINAWYYAMLQAEHDVWPNEDAINSVAYYVKPEVNIFNMSNRNYRRVNVVVGNDHPCSWQEVPGAMSRLISFMPEQGKDFESAGERISVSTVDEWIKHLLIVHPWQDGNGRTASVIWNWMKGTLENPQPLPFFFGEGTR